MKTNTYYLQGDVRWYLQRGAWRPFIGLWLALASLLLLAAVPAFGQGFSEAYKYGGRIHVPAPEPSEIEDYEIGGGIEAGGVLGCAGLDLDGMVDAQLSGIGGDNLSGELANAAKTSLFKEMMTRTMANPQVASVLENIQGTVTARVSMLQERCNAREIFADANNKRLQDEGMQRCVEEEGNMEICQRQEKREEYVQQAIDSDKWSKGLHQQLCEGGAENGCDWLTLVPDAKTDIAHNNAEAANAKALMDAQDLRNMATGYAVDMINQRVRAAEDFISRLGYAKAMQAVLYDAPGLPEEIDEALADAPGDTPDVTHLYTLHDHNTSKACQFSTARGMRTNMSRVMNAGGGDDVVFPISGANVTNADISSLFGPRTRPCSGCSSFHAGLDFAHPSGTGVLSSIGGVVRQASFNSCGGNMVVVEGGGTEVKYLHLSRINDSISPGDEIDAGTPLGQVGDTGTCTTGPHLHFTVKQDGALIDPLTWLGGDDSVLTAALGGEDKHGLTSMAVSRTSDESDEAFVVAAHKNAAQLGARMANTVRCNISKTLHPQVFVKMALMSGTTGPYSRGDLVSEDASRQEIINSLASGDKGALVEGLSKVYGQHAAVTTFSATINEMSSRIATASVGDEGMNKPLYNKARAELGRLKFERHQMIQTYNIECKATERLANAMDNRDARIDRAMGRSGQGALGLQGFTERPLRCEMFKNIDDDGLDAIIDFARRTDEDVEKMRQRTEQ